MESFNQFNYSRTSTVIGLSNIPQDKWDIQPSGYPNTIRWNAGHIYVTAEEFLNKADKNYEIAHPEWFNLFLDGTRPEDWGNNVPDREELLEAFKGQEKRIVRFFEGKLENKASELQTFHALKIDTVEAALQFVTWHEGIHLGIIKSLSLAVDNDS